MEKCNVQVRVAIDDTNGTLSSMGVRQNSNLSFVVGQNILAARSIQHGIMSKRPVLLVVSAHDLHQNSL
jgi:hypothetical protein